MCGTARVWGPRKGYDRTYGAPWADVRPARVYVAEMIKRSMSILESKRKAQLIKKRGLEAPGAKRKTDALRYHRGHPCRRVTLY